MRGALNPGSSLYSKKADALGCLVSASASVSLLAVYDVCRFRHRHDSSAFSKNRRRAGNHPQKSSMSNIPVCTTQSW
jgi:hypothetical protein